MKVQPWRSDRLEAFVRSKRFAVIHFDAEWDGANRAITRRQMQLAEIQFGTDAAFAEIDIDVDLEIALEIGISNVPAIAYFFDGKLVKALAGAVQDVRARIEMLRRDQ